MLALRLCDAAKGAPTICAGAEQIWQLFAEFRLVPAALFVGFVMLQEVLR